MIALEGSKARNMPGKTVILYIPVPAKSRNHRHDTLGKTFLKKIKTRRVNRNILGANANANLVVPNCWMKNNARRKTMEIGIIWFNTEGLATAIPATALVTETAGVRMPSAIVSEVAKRHYKVGVSRCFRFNVEW